MRMPVLAIAILLFGGGAAFADDVSQVPTPDVLSPSPPPARPPVKIIDAAPAAKSDQAAPALPAPPPAASSQAKTPDRPADDAGNRFNFVHVDDGFLRFDLKTGHVAYCNRHSDGWNCQAVPENRSALEREVGRLKDEVAALKRQVDSLREPPPPPRPPAPIPAPSAPSNAPPVQGDMTRQAPGHDDIARARAALHDVWQRLVEAIVGFKNDVMRKS
jgi:hypothetical protein